MNIDQLWKEYRKSHSLELRNELVLHYLPLARFYANLQASRIRIDPDEILGAAIFGLMAALKTYDPNENAKFGTFSRRRIIGAIWDWCRENDHQSRSIRRFERERQIAEDSLAADGIASEETIVQKMNMSFDEFQKLSRRSKLGERVLFSTLGDDSVETIFEDEQAKNFFERVEWREVLTRHLSVKERLIVTLYHLEGYIQPAIAKMMGLKETYVCRIRKSALLKLRRLETSQKRAA